MVHGRRYNPPQELPGGFYDHLMTPLAGWIKASIAEAYEAGYRAGRLDDMDLWCKLPPLTMPPSGCAIVTP